jgi:hypothetical protein
MSYYVTETATKRQIKIIQACNAWQKTASKSLTAKQEVELIKKLIKGCQKAASKIEKAKSIPSRRCVFDSNGRVGDPLGLVIKEAGLKHLMGPFYGPIDFDIHEPATAAKCDFRTQDVWEIAEVEFGCRYLCYNSVFDWVLCMDYDTEEDNLMEDMEIASNKGNWRKCLSLLKQWQKLLEDRLVAVTKEIHGK